MVGVPKSHGCATCRKRKIKCDENKPSCSKCVASGFACPGYVTFLKFRDEGISLRKKFSAKQKPRFGSGMTLTCQTRQTLNRSHIVEVSKHAQSPFLPNISIWSPPFSPSESLARHFRETFRSELPEVKNLALFGTFIMEIPTHVGLNRACDLSIEAVCLAHSALLTVSNRTFEESRTAYGLALAELQRCLVDEERATSPETLCAAMLLGIYEVLACTNKTASKLHVGGASRLIQMSGPGQFREPFAYEMLTALKGMIVIEAILHRRLCFLDSPSWEEVFENGEKANQHPFNTLFSILPRLPNLLSALRELLATQSPSHLEIYSIHYKSVVLRRDLKMWRETRAHADLFQTASLSTTAALFPVQISYTSNLAAALLCTYAAMLILLNCVLLRFSKSNNVLLRLENQALAEEICQSYTYSTECSPCGSGNFYMTFGLPVAYLVLLDSKKREWIVEKINDAKNPLQVNKNIKVTSMELDACYDYLRT